MDSGDSRCRPEAVIQLIILDQGHENKWASPFLISQRQDLPSDRCWRKRRTGPVYVQFGNEQLYQLEGVGVYLKQIKKVDCRSNILAVL